MRLKRIEIQGFKSFAKRVEIQFDGKITSIIGPNGSGKSNIADAVRWVLGEQSAKSLRGGKMEDVIFHGADGAKAQGFCEVILVFDNQDKRLSLDYSEIEILRRLHRSGESEYAINNNACRLRDIIELFHDTGVGKEGYSIIGQGRVENILSGKSDERRLVFEEAAGISKYKSRKNEADKKLGKTQENLQRIYDILDEVEAQVEPLRLQSEDAQKYLQLYEKIKQMDLHLFLKQYKHCKESLQQYDMSKEQIEEQVNNERKMEHVFAQKIQSLTVQTDELDSHIDEKKQEVTNLRIEIEKNNTASELCKQEINHLQEQNEKATQTKQQSIERMQELKLLLSNTMTDTDEQEKIMQSYQTQLDELQQQVLHNDEQIYYYENEIETQKNKVLEQMNATASARIEESRLQAVLSSLQERLFQVQENKQKQIVERDAVFLEREQEQIAFEKVSIEQEQLHQVAAQATHDTNELHEKEKLLSQSIEQQKRQWEQVSTRYRVLDEMKQSHEGYYHSVRKLLRDAEQSENRMGIDGVVAELVRVPKEYELAIETALGAAMQYIIVQSDEDAKKNIQYLRKKEYGRATFLPRNTMQARTLKQNEQVTLTADSCVGVASRLISYDSQYQRIFDNLLGRTVICRTLDEANALAKTNHYAFKVVTLEGDVINISGSLTGGSVQKNNNALLGRTRQIDELKKQIKLYQEKLESTQKQYAEIQLVQTEKQTVLQTAKEKLHEIDMVLARQNDKKEMLDKLYTQYSEQAENSEKELSMVLENQQDIEEQLSRAKQQQNTIDVEQNASQETVIQKQAELVEIRKNREEQQATFHALQLKKASLENEIHSIVDKHAQLTRESDTLETSTIHNNENIEKYKLSIQDSEKKLQSILVINDERAADIISVESYITARYEEKQKLLHEKEDMTEAEKRCSAQQKKLSEQQHIVSLKQNKLEIDLENMQKYIWNEYELTYDGACHTIVQMVDDNYSESILQNLKNSLRALGAVNMQSIDDYKAVNERFETLSTQKNDLELAKKDLETLITGLLENMQNQFVTEFKKINEYFSETFVELFGGGSACLVLTDPENALECDIDIIAQPPGKKRQLLSLLSGGERALTAIALLFSMLKLRPTPFCVLDEIEASLDEANVDNFAHYIKRYSDKTQFVLITHRKGSMAVSDVLYGVAMGGKGVSKVVSVRMDDYIQENDIKGA